MMVWADSFPSQTHSLSLLAVVSMETMILLECLYQVLSLKVWWGEKKSQLNLCAPFPVLQSCPDAIEEVFDSKLHIIGGVGITIGVIMVMYDCPGYATKRECRKLSLSLLAGVWDDP